MITDFIALDLSDDELAHTLKVLRAFKGCESREEWLGIPFMSWAKLEQFKEFLEHRVEGKPLAADTLAYIKRNKG